jgi:hypothetical protein
MRFLVVALALVLSFPASSLVVTAVAQAEVASLVGLATSSSGEVLANAVVQLRDLETGTVSGTTTSSSTGSFSFAAVNPGNYAVEILNAAGQVVGTSASISVAAGAAVTGVAVSATAAAVAAGAASIAGVSTIVAVTTAAAAAGVVGLVNVGQGDASPSR